MLPVSLSIDGKENIDGAVSFARKAKSLVGRWLAKSVETRASVDDSLGTDDSVIERDVIVLVNVKVVRGASAATILMGCHPR